MCLKDLTVHGTSFDPKEWPSKTSSFETGEAELFLGGFSTSTGFFFCHKFVRCKLTTQQISLSDPWRSAVPYAYVWRAANPFVAASCHS